LTVKTNPPDPSPVKPKRPHPLPGFCWVWIAGILHLSWLALAFFYGAQHPGEDWAGLEWRLWTIAGVFSVFSGGFASFWFQFAVRRRLSRKVWHAGTGLILGASAMQMLIQQFTTGVIYLLILAVWTQGHTRQFFDKA
jgi:hypothetical protein